MTTKFAAVTLKALAADPTIPQETKDALASLITMGNVAVAPPAGTMRRVKPAPRTFKTRAEIKAGNGYACSVAGKGKCKRTDIRTAGRATKHARTQGELQQFGHSADKAPLPK
jgi:hypothetical protein